MSEGKKAPKCHNCQHFYVSWDKKFPMGCKEMGFKGKQLPSLAVLQASGQHCTYFKPKPGCEEPEEKKVEVLRPGSSMTFTA